MPNCPMNTSPNELALARLLQLVSPSLPIGGYTYSQGIEWAVEAQWIGNQVELQQWLWPKAPLGERFFNLQRDLWIRYVDETTNVLRVVVYDLPMAIKNIHHLCRHRP